MGPLCTPLDVLARGINLPQAEIGDLVGVFQSGAYARSASPMGFLSHPDASRGLDRRWRRLAHPPPWGGFRLFAGSVPGLVNNRYALVV